MLLINCLVLIITYVNLVSTEATLCGDWTEFGQQKCIHIIDKEKFVNYENAIEMCAQTEKSHLITINSETEQKFIEKYLFKNNQIVDNVWIGLKNENGFKWSDKSSVDYTNWADKSPISDSDLNCVQMSSEAVLKGKWVNGNCNKKAVVICQKTIDIKNIIEENKRLRKENEELKANCKQDLSVKLFISQIKHFNTNYSISKPFTDFDNKQRVLFHVWNNTYHELFYKKEKSFTLCETYNSHIMEIRSKEKEEIVKKHISEWKIPPVAQDYYRLWLNGERDSSGKWRWNSDGMEFNYTNWGRDEPGTAPEYALARIAYYANSNRSEWYTDLNSSGASYIICEHEL